MQNYRDYIAIEQTKQNKWACPNNWAFLKTNFCYILHCFPLIVVNLFQIHLKCFKLFSASDKSCYDLNIWMLYIEFCKKLSVVRSIVYYVSIVVPSSFRGTLRKFHEFWWVTWVKMSNFSFSGPWWALKFSQNRQKNL